MSQKGIYTIGVIGAGMIARAKITWIAARNPENLERVRAEFDIPNKTHDYKDILKDPVISMELARKHMDIIFRCYNN